MLEHVWRQWISRPETDMRPRDVILWWERRRFTYNVVIGLVGIMSVLLFTEFITSSGGLQPGQDAVEPIALLLAPFIINICYTAGWVVELAIRMVRGYNPRVGPTLLAVGTGFSLFVFLFPTVFWGVRWLLSGLP